MEQGTQDELPDEAEINRIEDLDTLRAFIDRLSLCWGGDPEGAHYLHDALMERVLHLAADEAPNAPLMAREVIQMRQGEKWFA